MTALIICDDEPLVLDELKKTLNECISEHNLPYYIALVSEKPSDVVNFIDNYNQEPLVCILDVDLKSIMLNGIELGSLLCKACQDIYLIYISCHTEVAWKAFQHRLRCYDFIPKEATDIKERIKENLVLIKKEIDKSGNTKKLIEYNHYTINLDKLLYIEASENQHRLRIVTEDSFIEEWGALTDIRKKLPENFFFSHRRIIINLVKVAYFSMLIATQHDCDSSNKLSKMLSGAFSTYETDDLTEGLTKITNIPVKSLLASKLIDFINKDIHVSFSVLGEKIEQLYIDDFDAVRIFGILLDNAFEEAAETEEKHISIAAMQENGRIVFCIENSCRDSLPDSRDFIKKGFSTKSKDRGIGLSIFNEIISKYPYCSFCFHNKRNNTFSIELVLTKLL